MPILEQLQNHFQAYVWRHVLSILLGLMLLRGAKTLTSLRGEGSVPTLSRTLNLYPWPLGELGYPSPTDQPGPQEALPASPRETAHHLPANRRYSPAQARREAPLGGIPLPPQPGQGGSWLGSGLCCSEGGLLHCTLRVASVCQRALLKGGLSEGD